MLQEKVLRRLTIRSFHIEDVELCHKTALDGSKLRLDTSALESVITSDALIHDIKVQVVPPSQHNFETNTIMDIIPISTKVIGRLGDGITHTLTGVYVMLTGCDVNGKQMAEFGSSEGILSEQLMLGRAGTPDENDIIIHVDVCLTHQDTPDRQQPLAAFRACDVLINEIRRILKNVDGRTSDDSRIFEDKTRPGKQKVLIIKQVAGQGAMYDNLLFPNEPSGFAGGRSIIDLGNVPVVLSPNEYRDGAIRAMT